MVNRTTVGITEPLLASYAGKVGSGERVRLWDSALTGFGAIIGRRFVSFVVQHRVNGRQELRTIGRHGEPNAEGERWTVARARRAAMVMLGGMAAGESPGPTMAERSDRGPTLRDAYNAHVAKLTAKRRSAATIATLDKGLRRYLASWLDRPLSELTGAELVAIHAGIKEKARARGNTNPNNPKGAAVANRVIAQVSACWNTLNKQLGGALGNWNPASAVEKDTLLPKRQVVADLADWYKRVQTMRNPIQRDGLLFALFTGLRSEDVRTIQFDHVGENDGTLRIPDPKGGIDRAFTIPLPKTCLEIIELRRRGNMKATGHEDSIWVFPGVNNENQLVPIGDLRQQIHSKDGHGRFPVEDVHTLRRTYESVAHEAGISEIDLHVLTNHSYASHNVNATYIAQHIDHLRQCQDKIEAALWKRIGTKTKEPRVRGRSHAQRLKDSKQGTVTDPSKPKRKYERCKPSGAPIIDLEELLTVLNDIEDEPFVQATSLLIQLGRPADSRPRRDAVEKTIAILNARGDRRSAGHVRSIFGA